jgi:hypothetical protein
LLQVPLVLKEIESRTEDPLEKLAINKILQMKESSLRDLDDKMKWLKNFERLLEIQRNVVWPGVLEMEPKQYYPEFLKVSYCLRNLPVENNVPRVPWPSSRVSDL